MALIIEVVEARSGAVRARVRLDGRHIDVGRGYDNDLILDDAYVDARHARIHVDANGTAEIEDLGSINGLVLVGGAGRVPRVAASPGTEVRLGRTILRFRDPAEPVPPALPDTMSGGAAGRLLDSPVARIGACLSAVALVCWYTWLGSYERDAGTTVAGVGVFYVMFAALWSCAWGVASRVILGRFNFTRHLTVVAIITIPLLLVTSAEVWMSHLIPDHPVPAVVSAIIWCALLATLVALHLRLSSTLDRARQWRAAMLTVGVMTVLGTLLMYAGRESYTDVPEFTTTIRPYSGALLPAMDVAEFSDVVGHLTAEADELATE